MFLKVLLLAEGATGEDAGGPEPLGVLMEKPLHNQGLILTHRCEELEKGKF